MASSPKKRNVGRPRTLTDSAKKRYRREQNKAEIFKTKLYIGDQHERWLSKKEELGLTHVGLAKIWLDRFACFFSFTLVLCMFIFKITIILNAISSKIATSMILIKKTSLVLHTQEIC